MDIKQQVLSLKSNYRSGKSDLGRDFFFPCLSACKSYKRAVGFFSSSALITWSGALSRISQEEGVSIKLLVSPILTPEDKEALLKITDPESKELFLQRISDQIVLDAIDFAQGNQTDELRIRLFSWMIATEKLELRFAYPHHVEEPGIFHEKIGIFEFPWGDKVAFTGSANESEMGHRRNYESVDVFRSWIESDRERVIIKEEEFDEAWNGTANGLKVLNLSKEVVEKVKIYSKERPPIFNNLLIFNSTGEKFISEQSKDKWRHQEEAVSIFLQKERGVLEMATGTGKTRTSLKICSKLINSQKINSIIISMDGNDLLDQWYRNVLNDNLNFEKKFTVLRHYKNHYQKEIYIIDPEWKILIISRPELHYVLKHLNSRIGQKTLLIHDEVHRLGSPANRRDLNGLSDKIRYRLGLSATPEREYDKEGTEFIFNHIGPIIFRFGLEEAIKRGILCPFNYHPIEFEITEEDKKKIKQLMARYHTLKNTSNPMSPEELWTALANVYKTSEAKIPLFKQFIAKNQDFLKRCIIFVPTKEYGEKILNIVHKYNPDFHTYFSGEDSEILERFAKGELECLITCHRLSEGIDIKSLNNVILFSSDRSNLELIQRIGRCLRTDPTNPRKIANVVDFIRIKDNDEDIMNGELNTDEKRREWLIKLSNLRPEE